MVEVGVGDEEVVLADGPGGAAADVEGGVEGREEDAGLVAPDGDPLHGVALHLDPPPVDLRPGAPVLLLLVHGALDGGHVAEARRRRRLLPVPRGDGAAAEGIAGGGGDGE